MGKICHTLTSAFKNLKKRPSLVSEVKLAELMMVTKQERVYTDDLNDVETVKNFFDVMNSQYHFLNTYLLLDFAEHFLKSTEV